MPLVPQHLSIYLDAFRILSDHRPWRKGVPDPIEFTDLLLYAHEIGICGIDAIEFVEMVGVCDSEFTSHKAKEARQAIESARPKGRN